MTGDFMQSYMDFGLRKLGFFLPGLAWFKPFFRMIIRADSINFENWDETTSDMDLELSFLQNRHSSMYFMKILARFSASEMPLW